MQGRPIPAVLCLQARSERHQHLGNFYLTLPCNPDEAREPIGVTRLRGKLTESNRRTMSVFARRHTRKNCVSGFEAIL